MLRAVVCCVWCWCLVFAVVCKCRLFDAAVCVFCLARFGVFCLLFADNGCSLCVVVISLMFACCVLFVGVCGLLFVAHCVLFVVCCLVFVVCCCVLAGVCACLLRVCCFFG